MSETNREPGAGEWLEPTPTSPLDGSETFTGTELTVADFWRWSTSDLRENVTRGILAEFLVAQAVGDASTVRQAWAAFDVTSSEGTRIEVKASAYLQAWRQKKHSNIVFSGLSARTYSYETNDFSDEPSYSADVYVFATQRSLEHANYEMTDLDSWDFMVVSVSLLKELGSPGSISRKRLESLGVEPVPYAGLAAAVKAVHSG